MSSNGDNSDRWEVSGDDDLTDDQIDAIADLLIAAAESERKQAVDMRSG